MATQTPFRYDPVLTAVANVDPAQDFINTQVLPIVRVDGDTFKYLVMPRGQRMVLPETLIGDRGLPNEVSFNLAEETGATQGHALKSVVPGRVQEKGLRTGYYNPRNAAASGVRELLELGVEKGMAELIFNPASYATGHVEALATADQFDNPDSDPIRLVLRQMDNLTLRPNTAVVGQRVATALRLHPKIVKAFNRNDGGEGAVSLGFVAQYLGLQQVLIGTAKYNSANLGQEPNIADLWGNSMALLHSSNRTLYDGQGRVFAVTFAATFVNPINGVRFYASSWSNPEPGVMGVEEVKVAHEYVHKVIVPDAGFLYTNVVQS